MGDNVIDDATKVIEQRGGVPPPSWIVVCDRELIPTGSDQLACESHGRRKDRRSMAKRAKPAVAKQYLHLEGNRNVASRGARHLKAAVCLANGQVSGAAPLFGWPPSGAARVSPRARSYASCAISDQIRPTHVQRGRAGRHPK
jgi:hypothetical protein